MTEEKIPRRISNARPEGIHRLGRPRVERTDDVVQVTKKTDIRNWW